MKDQIMKMFEDIIGVVVVYEIKLIESKTINTLNSALSKINCHLNIIVYDNSKKPDNQLYTNCFSNLVIHYINNPENPGLSKAYNYALRKAFEDNKKWILILDQDTVIEPKYFKSLSEVFDPNNDKIVSYVPFLKSGDKIISPIVLSSGGYSRPLQTDFTGFVSDKELSAINSCSMVNAGIARKLGGYSDEFPLDYLDHWFYKTAFDRGIYIYVLDCILCHHLSVNNINKIGIQRYSSIISSEKKFIYMFNLQKGYRKRVIFRIIKLLLLLNFCKAWLNIKILLEKDYK